MEQCALVWCWISGRTNALWRHYCFRSGPATSPCLPPVTRLLDDPHLLFVTVGSTCISASAPVCCRNGVWYRQFVAASYPAVWREYRRTPMVHRHWYEVCARSYCYVRPMEPPCSLRLRGYMLCDLQLASAGFGGLRCWLRALVAKEGCAVGGSGC